MPIKTSTMFSSQWNMLAIKGTDIMWYNLSLSEVLLNQLPLIRGGGAEFDCGSTEL